MTPFREAAAAHSAAVDSVYGERLRLRPQTKGGRDFVAGGDDPERPSRTITGAVTRRPLTVARKGEGASTKENLKVSSATWQVSFDAALGLDLRAGDFVDRLDEPGTPTLRLSAPESIAGRTIHPAEDA